MWLSNFREGKEIVHTMFLPRETILIYSLVLGDTKLKKNNVFCFAYIQYENWGYYLYITLSQLSKNK